MELAGGGWAQEALLAVLVGRLLRNEPVGGAGFDALLPGLWVDSLVFQVGGGLEERFGHLRAAPGAVDPTGAADAVIGVRLRSYPKALAHARADLEVEHVGDLYELDLPAVLVGR